MIRISQMKSVLIHGNIEVTSSAFFEERQELLEAE